LAQDFLALPFGFGIDSVEPILVLTEPTLSGREDLLLSFCTGRFDLGDPGQVFLDPVDKPLSPVGGDPLVALQVFFTQRFVGLPYLFAEDRKPFSHSFLTSAGGLP